MTLRDVWAEINSTLSPVKDFTIENGGELYIWSYARTNGYPVGEIHCVNISVRAGGKFEPLTAIEQIKLVATKVHVNGNGYFRTNSLYLQAVNVTVDLSGRNTYLVPLLSGMFSKCKSSSSDNLKVLLSNGVQ